MTQQNWKKLGLIFSPNARHDWMITHAQQAVADHISGDVYRIYFASRDQNGYPRGASFEIDLKDPQRLFNISDTPILELGEPGSFDEHGVYPSAIVNVENKKYLYYAGRRNNNDGTFDMAIGLAISTDNGKSFKKYDTGFLFGAGNVDPWMVSTPWVYHFNHILHMVYISGISSSLNEEGQKETVYNLKYAYSLNGINWERHGLVAIDFAHDQETNICRPSIIEDHGLFKMWFSYACPKKGVAYRCGYAESLDGKTWNRKDDLAGIDISKDGFDSEMICYPLVIKHKEKKYMFYNGNGNGRDGLALAIME